VNFIHPRGFFGSIRCGEYVVHDADLLPQRLANHPIRDRQCLAIKTIEKEMILERQACIDSVWSERNVLALLSSAELNLRSLRSLEGYVSDEEKEPLGDGLHEPSHHAYGFLERLFFAFQDPTHLYVVTDFVDGGHTSNLRELVEMCNVVTNTGGHLPEDWVRFYAAEIVLGLEVLHWHQIVHRDLTLKHVLIGRDGHIVISGFENAELLKVQQGLRARGRVRVRRGRGDENTRGSDQAPEVLQGQWFKFSPDWWSLGVLLYELLHKQRPFASAQEVMMVARGFVPPRLTFREDLSPQCRSFLSSLLEHDPVKRLNGKGVRIHPWFESTDWNRQLRRLVTPPFMPQQANNRARLRSQPPSRFTPRELTPFEQKTFENFEFDLLHLPLVRECTKWHLLQIRACSPEDRKRKRLSDPQDIEEVNLDGFPDYVIEIIVAYACEHDSRKDCTR